MAVATLLLAAFAVISPALGCSYNSVSVGTLGAAAKPPDTNAYSTRDVHAHFMNQDARQFVRNDKATFSCVDARGDDKYLSTPGGDFAELTDATYLFFKQTGLMPTSAHIRTIFRQFMDKVATPQRPFYYHTDEGKLNEVFKAVGAAGVKPKPVILPAVQPKEKKYADIWYKYLTGAAFQGCGHIRLMMYNPKAYGISTNYIPTELLKQYFAYWWPTPLGSKERAKIDFIVKRGPLAGRAVVVAQNLGPQCQGQTPLIRNAMGGSSIFVYHKKAAADFRAMVLAPFFESLAKSTLLAAKPLPFNRPAFIKAMEALANQQLSATVSQLPPADSVGVFSVNYMTRSE